MDASYQARENTRVIAVSSGGVSIRGMMPRKDVEVKQSTGISERIADCHARLRALTVQSSFRLDPIAAGALTDVKGKDATQAERPATPGGTTRRQHPPAHRIS